MDNSLSQKVININSILDGNLLDAKHLYFYHFNQFASSHYRNGIDGEKAFAAFKQQYAENIQTIHQYKWYNGKRKHFNFDVTVAILNNKIIVEFDDNYCQIYHNNTQQEFVDEVIALVGCYKEKQRRQPLKLT
jgi:hypothetical protein